RGVVSGSWLLHFVETLSDQTAPGWNPNDLDIYLHEDYLSIMISFLLTEGYIPTDALDRPQTPSLSQQSCISRVLEFTASKGGQAREIDIVCSFAESPFEIILGFWGTHVMNAMTSCELTILYPDLTLARKGYQMVKRKGRAMRTTRRKYAERGYDIHS
ncbi:hypothetical protein K488DRAFT_6582, partial [Vararia minispora EC-137]